MRRVQHQRRSSLLPHQHVFTKGRIINKTSIESPFQRFTSRRRWLEMRLQKHAKWVTATSMGASTEFIRDFLPRMRRGETLQPRGVHKICTKGRSSYQAWFEGLHIFLLLRWVHQTSQQGRSLLEAWRVGEKMQPCGVHQLGQKGEEFV